MFELRPSAASVWLRCAGYASLNAAVGANGELIERDNEVRDDGTACHWLAFELWEGRKHALGSLAPNGRELTEEMFAAVEEYHALLRSRSGIAVLESKVPVSRFFPGVSDGTPDAQTVCADTLYVDDLKFGFRPVEVWRLPQLMIYGHTLASLMASIRTVIFTIYQPRLAHRDGTIRSWKVSVEELAQLVEPIKAAALECYKPNPICTVNPGCHDCGAAHACRSLQAASNGAMETAYSSVTHELTPAQLGYELARLMAAETLLEHRVTGLSAQAEAMTRRGVRIPGFDMVRAGTHWRWREGARECVQRLGQLMGVEVMAEPKIKTVAKLRHAFPPEVDIEKMYAEKPIGELRLKLTDPNEALKRFTSRK